MGNDANSASEQKFFLGRQPILDSDQSLAAYELLYRSAESSVSIENDFLATGTVIINLLTELGIDNVLGTNLGFINVSADLLSSGILELLPCQRIVLELSKTIVVDDQIVGRCHELKTKGFKIAIDDFIGQPGYADLFSIVDYVKFDILSAGPDAIISAARQLRTHAHIRFLAEKVEEREQFEFYRQAGFDLFQGFFFEKPVVLTGKKTEPGMKVLIESINLLQDDADVEAVYNALKPCPSLGIGLLRLVNSAASGLRRKVGSLKQALVLLGRWKTIQWLLFLLYSNNDDKFDSSALMELAAIRARTMELLCYVYPDFKAKRNDIDERAFLTGMLSLIDVALGFDKNRLIDELNIEDEISAALLEHKGVLGDLLLLAESIESGDFDDVADVLRRHGLSYRDLQLAQFGAIQWYRQLNQSS